MTRLVALLSVLTLIVAACGQTGASGSLPIDKTAEASTNTLVANLHAATADVRSACDAIDVGPCRASLRKWGDAFALVRRVVNATVVEGLTTVDCQDAWATLNQVTYDDTDQVSRILYADAPAGAAIMPVMDLDR